MFSFQEDQKNYKLSLSPPSSSQDKLVSAQVVSVDFKNATALFSFQENFSSISRDLNYTLHLSLCRPPLLIVPSLGSMVLFLLLQKSAKNLDLLFYPIEYESIDYLYFAFHKHWNPAHLKLMFSKDSKNPFEAIV